MNRHGLNYQGIILTVVIFSLLSPAGMALANSDSTHVTSRALDSISSGSGTVTAAQSDPVRIRFASGATSAQANGNLALSSKARYILRAMSGQLLDVTLSAPQGFSISVMASSDATMAALTSSSSSFRGYLPKNGDYIITVFSGSSSGAYSLNISIPQRISFKPGGTSATLHGNVKSYQSHDYILRAMAGQLMEINVATDSSGNSLQLIIYGSDGTVLRSGMGEGSSFRGLLPLSEDYIVTVRAGEIAVAYTITVIIPQRISFSSGAYSGSASGKLSAHDSQYYVLRANQGQTMEITLSSSQEVTLSVYGADGTVLKSGASEEDSFTGVLPSSQDYILVVKAGELMTRYQVHVTIP